MSKGGDDQIKKSKSNLAPADGGGGSEKGRWESLNRLFQFLLGDWACMILDLCNERVKIASVPMKSNFFSLSPPIIAGQFSYLIGKKTNWREQASSQLFSFGGGAY